MSDNLVKDLREKTEEADLDTILKTSTFGGYNRTSVREYIAMMRQQQYDLQQSVTEQLQVAQAERELLTTELASATARAAANEDALLQAKPMAAKAAELEKDMNEAIARIQSDAAKLEKQAEELDLAKLEIEELRAKLAQYEDESAALKKENEVLAAKAADAAAAAEVAAASGPVAEVVDATALVERSENLQVQVAILTRERESVEKRMEEVIRNEKRLFQALNDCRVEMENRRDQNLCLEAENKALSLRLSEQMWQNISLDREITHMRTMNENLKTKLDAFLAESVNTHDGSDLYLWEAEK